jgi:hypothetical protein
MKLLLRMTINEDLFEEEERTVAQNYLNLIEGEDKNYQKVLV